MRSQGAPPVQAHRPLRSEITILLITSSSSLLLFILFHQSVQPGAAVSNSGVVGVGEGVGGFPAQEQPILPTEAQRR